MTHYDDEALSAYLLDRAFAADPAALEAHVGECDACRAQLEELRAFEEAVRDPATWSEIEAMRWRSERLAEALSVNASIAEEDRAAARLLAHYLRSPLRFRDARISAQPRFRSAGTVRVLCAAAHENHEKRPRFSLVLATEALAIARLLPKESQGLCASHALRELAIALRYLGRFKESLDALAEAERLIGDSPAAAPYDRALIWGNRATVYMKSDRARDAIPLARAAADIFREYHDIAHEIGAVVLEACCHLMLGAPGVAIDGFERAIAIGRAHDDLAILVRGLHNAAVAYAELGNVERAATYYAEAMALYDELAVPTEKARARWGLASMLLRGGALEQGMAALAEAREELASLGLAQDAALATLEWAEARLAADMPAGVAEACRAIAVTFGSEGMNRNAHVALAYLNEAVRKRTVTPAVVRHVRDYLRGLPSQPDRAFAPLR